MIRDLIQSDSARSGPHPIAAYALTLHCSRRRSLLIHERWMRMLARCIEETLNHHRLALRAYVFLPTAVRLVVTSEESERNLPRVLYMIKRPFTGQVKPEIREIDRALWRELVERDSGGRYVFRFWEPGPGLIERLETPEAVLDAIHRMHQAPVDADLCHQPDEWRWSSWGAYHETIGASSESLTVSPIAHSTYA